NLLGPKASARGFRELESTRRQVLRLLDARWKVLRVSEFLPGQKQNLRCPRAHSAFQQDRSAGVDSWSNLGLSAFSKHGWQETFFYRLATSKKKSFLRSEEHTSELQSR